jgi:mono/diheme cytochrome c family protein
MTAERGMGQTAGAPSASVDTTSTLTGVYTAAQAARGEETYMAFCVGCHPTAMHTGSVFKLAWGGRPVSDLFGAIKEKMPKNDPGTLTGAETAQVVAYLLKINELPEGKTDLPEDTAALKAIRIELPAGHLDQAGGR